MEGTKRLLREKGHEVVEFTRNSAEIEHMRLGKPRALLAGVHSPGACRKRRRCWCLRPGDAVRPHGPSATG